MNLLLGIAEDRKDPLKLGRIRVRLFGKHSDKKVPDMANGEGIPTENLIWAHPMMPVTSASMNGIGESPTGIVEGSMVVCFARDGDLCNDLIIMGSVPGISQDAPVPDVGFNDPNGVYPQEKTTFDPLGTETSYLNESDVNRLSRGDEDEKITESIVKYKRDLVQKTIDEPIMIAAFDEDENVTWSEPENPYDAEYPFNHVKESESGHIEEIDDTPGAERLHRFHRSGTFEEIGPDGTKVTRIVKDNFNLVVGDDSISIGGNANITITGNANLYVISDKTDTIDGNEKETVKGTTDEVRIGEVNREFRGGDKTIVTGDSKKEVSGVDSTKTDGDCTVESTNYDVIANSKVSMDGAGSIIVLDPSGAQLDGPVVKIAGGTSEPITFGIKLLTWLNSHTHVSPVGPTSPPIKPAAADLLSTKAFVG